MWIAWRLGDSKWEVGWGFDCCYLCRSFQGSVSLGGLIYVGYLLRVYRVDSSAFRYYNWSFMHWIETFQCMSFVNTYTQSTRGMKHTFDRNK